MSNAISIIIDYPIDVESGADVPTVFRPCYPIHLYIHTRVFSASFMISILLQIRIWVVPHISTSLMLLEVDVVFIEQANDAVRIWLPKRLPSLAIQCALLLFSIKWILTDAVDDRWIITVQTLNYPITFKQSSLKVFFVK